MSAYKISEAAGAVIRPGDLEKEEFFSITDFGASQSGGPISNTQAINAAIHAASLTGGTVVIPKGTFLTYTIVLESNVNLYLEEGAVVAAAKTDIRHSYEKQIGEGGNYNEPEVNLYVGLQDHGHSYFANSLVYGADVENVMIYGKGLFTGGRFDEESGELEYVLQGGDPEEPSSRQARGHKGEWFGNKGMALVRCRNMVLKDFSFTIGGHFAIIAEGCENLYADHLLIDTTRDAFDIDCCRDVTVLNTTCNSLTDDGLCLKASFGAGIFKPLENVLIEDCVVSGYDAGSVYAGEYTRDKLIATDRCGPTGRVKFGTESTCGYHRVTIRRVKFDRSRGFCMEAVDCSSLTDVIFEDCILNNVSSSPIFLRAGDRGRFPVTGDISVQTDALGQADIPAQADALNRPDISAQAGVSSLDDISAQADVRLDDKNWVLPNDKAYHCYPVKRYSPHYNRTKTVTVDGHSSFEIVDAANPVQLNPVNYAEKDGRFYLKRWKARDCGNANGRAQSSFAECGGAVHGSYEADYSQEIAATDLPLYANGIGTEEMATVANILIRNVTVTNCDPRYPILLMGLTDSHIKNITLENISVEYRGGLTMEHAIEQRQLNTNWKFSQFHAKEHVQSLPWLVNTFFLKNEGLLPRADWDAEKSCWQDDPYNVPELPDVYPEPSNWGILPAYGIFARHVDGLSLRNIRFSCRVPDKRHICVLDDVNGVCVDGMEGYCEENLAPIAAVTDHYRRHTHAENVPEQPYFTTSVRGLEILKPLVVYRNCAEDSAAVSVCEGSAHGTAGKSSWIKEVVINAPAPGTPQDSLYPHPTVPCNDTGYRFAVDTNDYPLPLTVHRPFIQPIAPIIISPGNLCCFTLKVRNPASDISETADNGMIYNEKADRLNYGVKGVDVPLSLSCINLPEEAVFDAQSGDFCWTPASHQIGEYELFFVVDDGVMPEKMDVRITVQFCT